LLNKQKHKCTRLWGGHSKCTVKILFCCTIEIRKKLNKSVTFLGYADSFTVNGSFQVRATVYPGLRSITGSAQRGTEVYSPSGNKVFREMGLEYRHQTSSINTLLQMWRGSDLSWYETRPTFLNIMVMIWTHSQRAIPPHFKAEGN
jgi:hypothetical protein